MINNAKVGRRIAQLRQSRGLTQQQLASILNLSHQAVSKWESGAALPDIQTLLDLTRFFGITVENLLTEEETEEEADPSSAADEEAGQAGEEAQEKKPEGDMGFQRLAQMAPFMTREAIEEIAMQLTEKATGGQIARLAPFMRAECIRELIERHKPELTWDMLRKMAPFMNREDVDALARSVASSDKGVKTKENINKAFDEIGRAIDDIGKTIEDVGRGMGKAVKRAFKFGEGVISDVSAAFSEREKNPQPQRRSEKAESIRRKAFERALEAHRWDWLAAHINEIRQDPDLMARIAAEAQACGEEQWLCEHMGICADTGSVDAAIASENWAWLAVQAGRMPEEVQARIVFAALDAGNVEWIGENHPGMKLMGCVVELAERLMDAGEDALAVQLAQAHAAQDQQLQLADSAYVQGRGEALERYMDILEGGFRNDMIYAFAKKGDWQNVEKYIQNPANEMVEDLMEMAVDQGDFDAIDMLDGML